MLKKSEFDLTRPIKLVSFEEDGSLKLQATANKLLKNHLQHPCAFISIVGGIRQGKSLLLNLLLNNLDKNAAVNNRFSMSDGLTSHTRGLYIYPTPLQHAGINYYFIDCQGKENKREEDIKIYTVLCLICSLCIFQSVKTLTYEHDFLLPYLKSRKYIKEAAAENPENMVCSVINEEMKVMFLVRDCPDSKKAEIENVFRRVFLEDEPEVESKEGNEDSKSKNNEILMRNDVRARLKEEFQLTTHNLFTLPYYLDTLESNLDWNIYNEDVKEEILSKKFKDKAQELLKSHIVGKAQPLAYKKRKGAVTYVNGAELARLLKDYVRLINEGKIATIFNEMELLFTKVRDELFTTYQPALNLLFDNINWDRFKNLADFTDHYFDRFSKLQQSFAEAAPVIAKKIQVKVPYSKVVTWMDELEKAFKQVFARECELFEKELEIRKLEIERERLKKEAAERLRREEQQRKDQENLAKTLTLQPPNVAARAKPASNLLSDESKMDLESLIHHLSTASNSVSKLSTASSTSKKSQFIGDITHLLDVKPEEAKRRLDAIDTSTLSYKMDGTLDLRYNSSKEYLNLLEISKMQDDVNSTFIKHSLNGTLGEDDYPPHLPRKKDGTLDMRFSVNKEYMSQRSITRSNIPLS
jgi:methylphosphotriester-DNA--protein-cysteine methyltransferase